MPVEEDLAENIREPGRSSLVETLLKSDIFLNNFAQPADRFSIRPAIRSSLAPDGAF